MTDQITAKVTVTPHKINSSKDDAEKRELLKEGFKELKAFLQPDDLGETITKFGVSPKTFERRMDGLLGSILYLDMEMYKFMFNRIDKRVTLVAAA